LGEVGYRQGDKHYGGYHPGEYSYPKTDKQRFEICVGAILTQNTAWSNVAKALINLKKLNAIDARKIKSMSVEKLKAVIKPAGYFNQKAKKLKFFTDFYLGLKGNTPTREQLLSVWGVGKETADSILLYAYKVPSFVVDAYTRRIVINLRLVNQKAGYEEIQELFEKNLRKDYKIFQEYHALLVEHAKRHYGKKEDYANCPLYRKLGNRLRKNTRLT
jgi:endonuclease-3 related protein